MMPQDQEPCTNAPRIQGAETYTYVRDWPLDPGEYDFHLVVEDVRDGQLSATRPQLDVPEAATDWQTSDLMLVTSDDNQEGARQESEIGGF